MEFLKALIVGAVASLFMFLAMAPLIAFDIAPFNLPPHTALLAVFHLNIHPLPWLVHFLYGMFWSVVFVFACGKGAKLWQGLLLSVFLWLGLMLIFGPLIGYGFFGYGSAHELAPNDPLYLRQGYDYALITLGLHLIYGGIIGWLNPFWDQWQTL